MLVTATGSEGLICLKQALFRVFHVAQTIAATPTVISFLSVLEKLRIHAPSICLIDLGLFLKPKEQLATFQIYRARGQAKTGVLSFHPPHRIDTSCLPPTPGDVKHLW